MANFQEQIPQLFMSYVPIDILSVSYGWTFQPGHTHICTVGQSQGYYQCDTLGRQSSTITHNPNVNHATSTKLRLATLKTALRLSEYQCGLF